jgi:molybdenum cofactor biosynthesis protein MoaC
MRDVSRKPTTLRTAVAGSSVTMSPATVALVRAGQGPKGDPLPVARVAGVMAAKDTSRIVPFCHPVRIDHVDVAFEVRDDRVDITCRVTAVDRTGVEMEALCGAMVAALTIYDMLKPVDEALVIGETRLLKKKGGKSDFVEAFERPLRGAVLVVSDSVAAGTRVDGSGKSLAGRMAEGGVVVGDPIVLPDDPDLVAAELRRLVAAGVDLIFTTGGTGLGPRDLTVEAVRRVIEREVPGITEAMRVHGYLRTPRAVLSRGLAGVVGTTLIVTLPGSTKGVAESLDALWPALLHIFPMIWGGGHPPA